MTAKVISFINMKGGVGKTTVAVNLGYELAATRGKKVLLVDMDPQFNATQLCYTRFQQIEEYDHLRASNLTIAGLLLANSSFTTSEKITPDMVVANLSSNLYIIPGDLRLTDFEASRRGSEKLLRDNLNALKKNYDFIFIDTPATYSIYSQASLIASDFYVVPMVPDMFAALGYTLLRTKMESDPIIKELHLKSLGIVVNLWSKKVTGRQKVLDDLKGENFFHTKISEHEVNRTGKGQRLMTDRQLNSKEIRNLADELLKRIAEVDTDE